MRVPLEPIPTEQIVVVKQRKPTNSLRAIDTRGMGKSTPTPNQERDTGQLEKAYPWLLGVSTCLSALLCWMYVSKPVIVQESGALPPAPADNQVAEHQSADSPQADAVPVSTAADLMPSDSRLPSSADTSTAVAAGKAVTAHGGMPTVIDPRLLTQAQRDAAEQGVGTGWEKTNLKVQHILSADAGTGEHEKIVINVPVLYETRSMRWTPAQVEKARGVLGRLMLYERNLSNLRKEGASILDDWNQIIRDTVPAASLRADSPSLPYNHGQGGQPEALPGSASVIQVEEK